MPDNNKNTNRWIIINFLADRMLDQINTDNNYNNTLVTGSIVPRLVFMNEVNQYPTISIAAGVETREYQPNLKWSDINAKVRLYISDQSDPLEKLDTYFSDLEKFFDENRYAKFGPGQYIRDIEVLSLADDQGLFRPENISIGEMSIRIRTDFGY